MPTYARSKTNGFFRFRSRHSYCPKDEQSDNFLTPLTSKRKREAVHQRLLFSFAEDEGLPRLLCCHRSSNDVATRLNDSLSLCGR